MLRELLGIGATTASFLLVIPTSTLSDPSLDGSDFPCSTTSTGRPAALVSVGEALVFPPVPEGKPAMPPGLPQQEAVASIRTVQIVAPKEMPGASEPDLDLDPLDPDRMAVSVTAARAVDVGQVPYPVFFSDDVGKSWERSFGDGPFPIADPGLEFGASGRLYLSALDASLPGGSRGVVVARSDDGGRSFPRRVFALDASTSFLFPDGARGRACNAAGGPLFDYPKLAADRSERSPHRGALYLVALAQGFDRNGDGLCEGGAYVFIGSKDGGKTWENGRVFEGMQLHTNRLAVGPDGVITLAQAVDGTGPGGRRPGIWIHRSTDGGTSFASAARVLPAGEALEPSATWAAADPSDPAKLYVAFEGRVKGGDEIGHVYVARSSDSGSTWQGPVRVDADDTGREESEALRPALAVSPSGRLDIAWFDYRHSGPIRLTAQRQTGDIYFASSTDGGATWSRNLRLSKTSAPAIFAPGNATLTLVSQSDRALAAFALDTDADDLYETWLADIEFR